MIAMGGWLARAAGRARRGLCIWFYSLLRIRFYSLRRTYLYRLRCIATVTRRHVVLKAVEGPREIRTRRDADPARYGHDEIRTREDTDTTRYGREKIRTRRDTNPTRYGHEKQISVSVHGAARHLVLEPVEGDGEVDERRLPRPTRSQPNTRARKRADRDTHTTST